MVEQLPAKCRTCRRMFQFSQTQLTCSHCGSESVVPLFYLSNTAVLTVILSIMALELEATVIVARLFAGHLINPLGHAVILAATVIVATLAYKQGWKDFVRLRRHGAQLALTGFQSILVVLVLMSFVVLFLVFCAWQSGWK